ncbi:hypothetical protein I5U77_08265 [Stenotrophomonas maltophilia]|nr:hypothetical protein [Stenotrophomonas maltophilia]
MADQLLTAAQAKHTARVFITECRARRNAHGGGGSPSMPPSVPGAAWNPSLRRRPRQQRRHN